MQHAGTHPKAVVTVRPCPPTLSHAVGASQILLVDPVTRAVRYAQPKGEKALIFNGRIAFADIDIGASDAKLTVAVWARNLFNQEHLFYKGGAPRSGVQGFFNEPRTFGVEAKIKM